MLWNALIYRVFVKFLTQGRRDAMVQGGGRGIRFGPACPHVCRSEFFYRIGKMGRIISWLSCSSCKIFSLLTSDIFVISINISPLTSFIYFISPLYQPIYPTRYYKGGFCYWTSSKGLLKVFMWKTPKTAKLKLKPHILNFLCANYLKFWCANSDQISSFLSNFLSHWFSVI
jgi:hypothetical protein